ncbi:MAG: hypothetical protein EU530_01165 [Promethearchaeota archaeon]|nr:MAG: hypothetical protein EU530_01165 [Candidatus Lokiarchaeota archaeon]
MSEVSGAILIQKTDLRALRKKLKKHKYDYVIIQTRKEKWVYVVLDKDEEEKEKDFDEFFEDNMEGIDWDISLSPEIIMNFRTFSKSFPILFLEYSENYGWGYVFFVLGEIRAGFFLDYDTDEPTIQEIREQLRMANPRELKLLGLKRSEIKGIRELLDKNIVLQDIKGELEIPLVNKFLHILGINDPKSMNWNSMGYINDPEFLRFQRRFILQPLKRYGFRSYKTSDMGRICDGCILQYIEFQKSRDGEGEYYVNVWIRPLFNDSPGIGGRMTLFPEVPTHGGEFWSEETKSDIKLVRDAIMEFILPWFEQHSTPQDLINQFEHEKKGEMENWTPYDIAMVYLWIKEYEKGAYHLKQAQIAADEQSSLEETCKTMLSQIESWQFEEIQKMLNKTLVKIQKNVKKLQNNFITTIFESTLHSVEDKDEMEDLEDY